MSRQAARAERVEGVGAGTAARHRRFEFRDGLGTAGHTSRDHFDLLVRCKGRIMALVSCLALLGCLGGLVHVCRWGLS